MPGQHRQLLSEEPDAYAALVRNVSGHGILLLDPEARVKSWNRGAERMTGWSEGDVAGLPYEALFANRSVADRLPARQLESARSGRLVEEESLRSRSDGLEFTVSSTLEPVRGRFGELKGYVEVFADISLRKAREEDLFRRATRDPLTGALNRAHFSTVAEQELERARRFSEPLTVVMLDIDHFKRINDSYGHPVGDRAIISLVELCLAELRAIDTVGRVGGEEFALLLPRANKEPAVEIMQRLRRRIAENVLECDGGIKLSYTVSIGLATRRPHLNKFTELLRCADQALYKAKNKGRNRVEAWFE